MFKRILRSYSKTTQGKIKKHPARSERNIHRIRSSGYMVSGICKCKRFVYMPVYSRGLVLQGISYSGLDEYEYEKVNGAKLGELFLF